MPTTSNQTQEEQALATAIRERLDDCDWTDYGLEHFTYELNALGITTSTAFEERFRYATADYRPFKDFVMYLVWELFGWADDLAELEGLVVDWEASWEQNYSRDYSSFRFDGKQYFCKNSTVSNSSVRFFG